MRRSTFSVPSLSLLILFLGLVLVAFSHGRAVRAQQTPTLVVSPAQGTIIINNSNTITLELVAANVVNMQSFEVTLAYDPSVIKFESWALGELVSVFNWKLAEQTSPPGHFYLAYGRFAGGPVSGDGVLLEVTFSGVGKGTSPVAIALARYSAPTGEKTVFVCQDGSVSAVYDPTLLPKSTLSGRVLLQGRANPSGASVFLSPGAFFEIGPYVALSQNLPGINLRFDQVVNDTYTLNTGLDGYLNPALQVTLTADLTLPPLHLLGGDVNGDDRVDTTDLDAIRAAFGSPGAGIAADINGDGVVNLQDLALAAGNFGLTTDEAYAQWMNGE
ncbi:MAG TPA: dockerin type I domain-containing protein [Brevefilum fermentans]|uniref:dockerin type I domain-containing protein n=1 Tax=Candidatus Brevifilum fermentans TaxID=1986204 RepID=UPI000B419F23|nr:dockerin type I domain-containing protein [Brevefilum fermentans]MDI9566479.1 dockerin type I domain-containing protein [Chloroflexota bacterium]HOM68015.1 dockerin type I domain-containing protein [Brevefilum fermentans]